MLCSRAGVGSNACVGDADRAAIGSDRTGSTQAGASLKVDNVDEYYVKIKQNSHVNNVIL